MHRVEEVVVVQRQQDDDDDGIKHQVYGSVYVKAQRTEQVERLSAHHAQQLVLPFHPPPPSTLQAPRCFMRAHFHIHHAPRTFNIALFRRHRISFYLARCWREMTLYLLHCYSIERAPKLPGPQEVEHDKRPWIIHKVLFSSGSLPCCSSKQPNQKSRCVLDY